MVQKEPVKVTGFLCVNFLWIVAKTQAATDRGMGQNPEEIRS